MAKITQVTIINPTTLRLDVDAKMGDEIDLLDISKIDNMLVQEIINKEKDKEIKKLLDNQKKIYDLEKTNEINQLTEKLKDENSQLKNKIKAVETQTRLQTELEFKDKISDLQSQINRINLEKDQIEKLKNEYKSPSKPNERQEYFKMSVKEFLKKGSSEQRRLTKKRIEQLKTSVLPKSQAYLNKKDQFQR